MTRNPRPRHAASPVRFRHPRALYGAALHSTQVLIPALLLEDTMNESGDRFRPAGDRQDISAIIVRAALVGLATASGVLVHTASAVKIGRAHV